MQGKCYLCGKNNAIHTHHVFQGRGRRQVSDKYGATIRLCLKCHEDVHNYKVVRLALQEEIQRKLMKENNWTVQDFVQKFGRNYT